MILVQKEASGVIAHRISIKIREERILVMENF